MAASLPCLNAGDNFAPRAFVICEWSYDVDNIKAEAAEHHQQAAHHLEKAAQLHHDAAKQCLAGNFAKAESLATSAAEIDTLANRHAVQAGDLYRHHAEEVAGQKAEHAAEDAARAAKHEAKAKQG